MLCWSSGYSAVQLFHNAWWSLHAYIPHVTRRPLLAWCIPGGRLTSALCCLAWRACAAALLITAGLNSPCTLQLIMCVTVQCQTCALYSLCATTLAHLLVPRVCTRRHTSSASVWSANNL